MFKCFNGWDKYGGVGFGLNIVMKMVKRINGDIFIF